MKGHSHQISWDDFLGQTQRHLTEIEIAKDRTRQLHQLVVADWVNFTAKAREKNLELSPISSFRSFEQQLNIWNAKARGQRRLLDNNANPIDIKTASEETIFFAILRWSALPGLSRHHWGSDIDIVDENALKHYQQKNNKAYSVGLVPSEYEKGGIFEDLGKWAQNQQGPFYRPYSRDLGGVAIEPWHFSHREVSQQYEDFLHTQGPQAFRQILNSEIYRELELKNLVLQNFDVIIEKYFYNITRD